MAKKKNQTSNNEQKHEGGGGGNKENDGVTVVVLKIDLHCEGCAGRVVKAVRSLDGVESVRIGDSELDKLTVIGKLDPVKLRQSVEEKTRKKVELISPATKKDNASDKNSQSGGGGEPKKQQKPLQQPDKEKTADKKPKELPVTTAILKVPLHCQGCIQKIHKLVSKTKGFVEMSIDKNKDLLTVKGGIDMKLLAEALKKKLKRPVEIVPQKKEGGGGGDGGEKKGKGGGEKGKGGGVDGGEGGEKKAKSGGGGEGNGGAGGGNVEGHKMEHYGGQGEYPQYAYGPGYMVNYVHAPQLFSDENPNACSIM